MTPAAPEADLLRLSTQRGPIDCLADLHLQRSQAATWAAFARYLHTTEAQHVLLLGDVFEVWVGDDALLEGGSFEAEVAAVLRETSRRKNLYLMHGNRDFLIGADFAQSTGVQLLADPTVLEITTSPAGENPSRWLLSHGDALCTSDLPYQQFRALSRQPAWQRQFLAQPLELRRTLAAGMRSESEQRKAGQSAGEYIDLDTDATRAWLQRNGCTTLIHGHTHQSGAHDLGDGLRRIVLSDWDFTSATTDTQAPRGDLLRLQGGQCQRLQIVDIL